MTLRRSSFTNQLQRQMNIDGKLLVFATGVALTALLHLGGLWANNERWESEMVNHGWG